MTRRSLHFLARELTPRTVAHRLAPEEQRETSVAAESLAAACGMALSVSDRLYDRRHPCPWPWLGTYIDVNGNVIPCCRIGDAEICAMGNLFQEKFGAIWNSAAYRTLRRRLREGNIPAMCTSCYRGEP